MISSVLSSQLTIPQVQVLRVGGPDEGFGLLVDEIARLAGVGIDLDDAEPLMAAIDLLIGEVLLVLHPSQTRRSPLQLELSTSGLICLAALDVEQVQLVGRELVARQGIGPLA